MKLYTQNFSKFSRRNSLNTELIEQVLFVIKIFPSKIEQKHQENPPLELQIVQDADRLDAIVQLGLQELSILVDSRII